MRSKKFLIITIFGIFLLGLIIPEYFTMPVTGAGKNSYHPKSFWFYPWGESGTHKGVDIFAPIGTNLKSATPGVVVFTGELKRGGKFVAVLGPKWRIHYYAHLNTFDTKIGAWLSAGEVFGEVGDTGNAKGKPAHLHYSIITLIPYFHKIDDSPQGWRKLYYLNPVEKLNTLY